MNYFNLDRIQLETELDFQKSRFDALKAEGLSYDMTRGKPCKDQLDLSLGMLDPEILGDFKNKDGIDCRNYGGVNGITEAREMMSSLLGVPAGQVMVGSNSSLNCMYDLILTFLLKGASPESEPWIKDEKRKFICPVPGYDRHFGVTEALMFDLIPVDINPDGPDMEVIEELVKDPSVKGMWSVPKYSNPTGYVYSDETIRRLASMKCACPDFRIMWDDAYTVHYLGKEPAKQLNLIEACREAGNPDRAIMICSTSKITFPGSGIAAIASSEENIKYISKVISRQTIGPDKMNQLRHVRFLKDYDNILAHMEKHAQIIRPKFRACIDTFEKEFADNKILEWTNPEGGYFISANTPDGCAKKVVSMCKEAGVSFTPAGATYPYGKDPRDRNIRIAPTVPPLEDIGKAIEVFCVCVKITVLEQLLNK